MYPFSFLKSHSLHSNPYAFLPSYVVFCLYLKEDFITNLVHSVIKKQVPYWMQGLWVSFMYLAQPLQSTMVNLIYEKILRIRSSKILKLGSYLCTYSSVKVLKILVFWTNLSVCGSEISVKAFLLSILF